MDNNKKIEEVIEEIKGKIEPTQEQLDTIKNIAEQYSNKSGEEIVFEIIKLNKKLKDDMGREEFLTKLKQLESLRPMLNEEQSQNLDRLLKILKGNE
ncbi:hypothetical protein SAMN05660462_00487 [Proteiniborus ethanoligenes]|uniref:Uncharacterized protein n=1 Tax=Proteiniborus ethanoligenes TaxID=415015 RepID=A0A1H3LCV9_9FIRM|nr:hypothetical protein [Proteiniborus ethanoligenes]TAH63025.1 MAG: hypothetical protein EWM50_04170 [Gottschalkiaceae bacterium]SDY62263.1 hypothetical protein SAMN05660462_00487 [Proteiniborus ethanoligenes]